MYIASVATLSHRHRHRAAATPVKNIPVNTQAFFWQTLVEASRHSCRCVCVSVCRSMLRFYTTGRTKKLTNISVVQIIGKK